MRARSLLWLVLFAAYAATLGLPRSARRDYARDEPHHLLAAESIVSDRDVDLPTSTASAPTRVLRRRAAADARALRRAAASSRTGSASRC